MNNHLEIIKSIKDTLELVAIIVLINAILNAISLFLLVVQ